MHVQTFFVQVTNDKICKFNATFVLVHKAFFVKIRFDDQNVLYVTLRTHYPMLYGVEVEYRFEFLHVDRRHNFFTGFVDFFEVEPLLGFGQPFDYLAFNLFKLRKNRIGRIYPAASLNERDKVFCVGKDSLLTQNVYDLRNAFLDDA
jgi:hypothetical protein